MLKIGYLWTEVQTVIICVLLFINKQCKINMLGNYLYSKDPKCETWYKLLFFFADQSTQPYFKLQPMR